ncbi:MAG: hypothetical protein ACI9SG_000334 [Maribacter sp.]|jgi:hypothetical protein
MKNRFNLGAYVLCTFTLLSILSCNTENKKKSNETIAPIAILPPSHIISLEQAKSTYDNYTKHRINLIEPYETEQRVPEEKFEPARFVDFDYEMIKDYIQYVDQEAKKAGVKKVTKLRMYFANYPNEKKFKDGKEVVHPRQNSLFLLPTLEKNGGDYGFYIGDDGKAKLIIDWKDNPLKKGIGSVLKKERTARASIVPNFFSNVGLYSGQSLILNRSGSGPPPRTEF